MTSILVPGDTACLVDTHETSLPGEEANLPLGGMGPHTCVCLELSPHDQ